ncbi:MAG: chitobiase/beta-hexosaminidase C-terminal domain-containing protein, partial [Bacteroidales bacterium]|nr:chitobiase/beta-hexosaminidase C-terminal domain-containing protein [Bacteroidales bacterium]
GPPAAPVLTTVYPHASPLVISGWADGKYHAHLYMVFVTAEDTTVVGFDENNPQYVHRDVEVKHPAVYFSPKTLKITTYRGTSATGKVQVTGWALPTGSTVNFNSNNANFTVTSSLTQAQVMATGGAEITVTYNGADAAATATITATCGAISSTFTVNGIAKDTLANLKGIYGRANNDTVLVRGKMVVMHKDSNSSGNTRVWVQDMDKENGASMMLYRVAASKGYSALKVGDVLQNVAGRVNISSGLYRFTPLAEKVEAVEHNHEVYVDTMSLLDVRANSNKAEAQNALVCIKDVRFRQTGNFGANRAYTLLQGKDTLVFRTDYAKADYIGKPIPSYGLYVTGIVGYYNGTTPQITARNLADLAEAPCLAPTDFDAEVSASEATMEWTGAATNYSVRYAKEEADLATAEVKTVSNRKSFTATGLDALTTYYYQVKSLCSETNESDWSAVQNFTTLSATAPSITMLSPVDRPTFTDSVLVLFRLNNVSLNAGDITASIVFSDGYTVDNLTDTVYRRAMPSGDYNLLVVLKKDGNALNPNVQSRVRYFSVDLPDVATPVFTPKAGRYNDSVEVTLSCATQGASIFYAKNEGEYVAYTAGSKFLLKENATFKAFACKERMDTSAVATAAYTIHS